MLVGNRGGTFMKANKLVLAAVLTLVGAIPAMANEHQLATIREATAKYKDVKAALADGFIPDPSGQCVSAAAEGMPAEMGAMGIHYLNPARLGITATAPRVTGTGLNVDFNAPSVLLYEPQADGSLVLAGVEDLVFITAWEAAGNSAPPKFGDQVWEKMADMADTAADEAHGFEPHYDLHVWTERANPSGPFVSFNPAVTCPKG